MPAVTASSPISVRRPRAQWPVPVALILVSLIPVIFGSLRLAQLTGGAEVTPENARFFDSPLPVLVHIPAAIVFSLVGAFQFVPSLRRGGAAGLPGTGSPAVRWFRQDCSPRCQACGWRSSTTFRKGTATFSLSSGWSSVRPWW